MTITLHTIVPRLIAALLGAEDEIDRQPAVDLVTAFSNDASRTGAWNGVDKAAFCGRLAELVGKPHELNQAGTSFCAPAAALYAFAWHYPRRFADFGIRLFETGNTRIGARTIGMTEGIRSTHITDWITGTSWGIHVTDLLLMLAVLEDMTWLNIDKPGDYALAPPWFAGSYASDIRSTLGGSGLFEVQNLTATAAAIQALDLPKRSALVLVGSMEIFSEKFAGRHAAVLVPPVTLAGANVTFRFWSWGTFENHNTFPVVGGQFRERTVPVSFFDAKIDKAVRVTATGVDV